MVEGNSFTPYSFLTIEAKKNFCACDATDNSILCLCSQNSKIVLVATQDSASKYMSPAIDPLKRLGATDPLQVNFRDSFAFAGYAGVNKPQWITQERADRYRGPSEIFPQIPLAVNQ